MDEGANVAAFDVYVGGTSLESFVSAILIAKGLEGMYKDRYFAFVYVEAGA